MDRKSCEIESLVIRPGFHDVTHVPLADMHRVVAHVRQHLGERHFLAREAEPGDVDSGIAHAVAVWMATSHECYACRRTGWLCVHAR